MSCSVLGKEKNKYELDVTFRLVIVWRHKTIYFLFTCVLRSNMVFTP